MSALRPLGLIGLALLMGCLGSPEPYRPGYVDRPAAEPAESAEEYAQRTAISVDLIRSDARLLQGRKEVDRILGGVSPNPWNAFRDDMVATLGEEGARPYLGSRPPTREPLAAPEPRPADTDDGGWGGDDDGGWGGDDGGGGWGADDW